MAEMICPACTTRVTLGVEDSVCPSCGKKLRETVAEMEAEIARQQAAHSIRRARLYLVICALIQLAWTGFLYLVVAPRWSYVDPAVKLGIATSAGVTVALFVCWLWAAPRPVPATLVALVLYAGLTLAQLVSDPLATLGSPVALTFKALVIAALASGLRAAFRYRRLTRFGVAQ